jgi:hypothetical protein
MIAVFDTPFPAPKMDQGAKALRRPMVVQHFVGTVVVDLFGHSPGNHGPDPILMFIKEGIIAVSRNKQGGRSQSCRS